MGIHAREQSAKPHFSASQLLMHAMCPESYRRRYEEKEIIPPGVAALRGKGMHGAAATNMRQKLTTGRDLPVNQIIEAGIAEFETESRDGVMLTPEEASVGVDKLLGQMKDDLAAIIDVHAKLQAPAYQPLFVEHAVRIELPNAPRDYLGIIDLGAVQVANEKRGVVDFKTAKRSKSQADADQSIQLTGYAACFAQETGEVADFVALDTVVQTTKETKRQYLESERTQRDFDVLAARVNAVQRAIDAGVYTPAAPGAWNCSLKWCGYARDCVFFNAERASNGE